MDVLKSFVGDGNSAGTTVATMTPGDIFLVNANTNAVLTASAAWQLSNSTKVKVVGKTNKGLKWSVPFSRNDVIQASYKPGAATVQKVVRFPLNAETYAANTTYSLGVMIKENQRAVYNRDATYVANYTTGSTVTGTGAVTDFAQVASAFAKYFASQPIMATGSPVQMIKVERYDTGSTPAVTTIGVGSTAVVTQGSRIVTFTGAVHALVAGSVVSLDSVIYVVDSVQSTTQVTLDVPYVGSTTTLPAWVSSVIAGKAGIMTYTYTSGATVSGLITFRFTGVAQARENKYSQNTEVDFNVIYPRGYVAVASVPTVTTAFVPGYGTYGMVRQIEETSYTNATGTRDVGYRAFPSEDFVLNVDLSATSAIYNIFVIDSLLPDLYPNFMQSGSKSTRHSTVMAIVNTANGDGNVDETNATDKFGSVLVSWYGATSATPNTTGVVFGDYTFSAADI